MTGIELSEALRLLGITQRAFADEIGYREESVSRWVREREPVPKVVALAVRKMLETGAAAPPL